MTTIKKQNETIESIVGHYLDNDTSLPNVNKELEVRFGTLKGNKVKTTKNMFDNVIAKLLSMNFECQTNGDYSLKIMYDHINKKGFKNNSNIRVELKGYHTIKEYCEKENLSALLEDRRFSRYVLFEKKEKARNIAGEQIHPVEVEKFNLKVSYQQEQEMSVTSPLIRSLVQTWDEKEKTFRYIKRYRFKHPTIPINCDLSIVKTNSYLKEKPFGLKKTYILDESNVFNNAENYEIELEIDNDLVKNMEQDEVVGHLKKTIKYVLCGMQNTNYPTGIDMIAKWKLQYIDLIGKMENKYIEVGDFIGPSSYTLEQKNVMKFEEETNFPCILENYTVTDKADGERSLLFITENGDICLIDSNMEFSFSGLKTTEKKIFNTIIDGELIKYNKMKKYINLFAAFDIYYINKKNVKKYPLAVDFGKKEPNRYMLLKEVISKINPINVVESDNKMRIQMKYFEIASDKQNIFKCCEKLLTHINDPSYEYETDGLIFTPANIGVPNENYKITWEYSFKWKPPKFNTIDFLVKFKKNEKKEDEIHTLYSDGVDLSSAVNSTSYKTLILMCGFKHGEKGHGYMNPCQMVLEDNIPSSTKQNKYNKPIYEPMPFYPTTPYDPEASICNLKLLRDQNDELQIYTENGEIIEDNTIVEFSYDCTEQNKSFRWVPLRVRYDKTHQLRSGKKQFGNAYHVANSNWKTIHNPVTEEMLRTGNNIPDELVDDDVYYNCVKGKSPTRSLRDFHNMVVKKMLINSVAKRGNTLVDVAVGKGGDLPKWINAKLSFIYGIDIMKDNIENKLDGACSRYINNKKDNSNTPNCIFVQGNSSENIKSGEGIIGTKYKEVNKAIFGMGPKDETKLGKGVYKQYGKGENGFHICSCQFAMHYFFEDRTKLQKFMQNISELTRIGGYYIGTCYDGKAVFNMLKSKKKGDSVSYYKQDSKIFEIVKQYDNETFDDELTSVGYAVDVYQESINKVFREHLVNFDYLIRLMEIYGFVLPDKQELSDMPSNIGTFKDLYNYMENDLELKKVNSRNLGDTLNMSIEEKKISFLNKYFIFKKVRNVDPKMIVLSNPYLEEDTEPDSEPVVEITKKKKKITLKNNN